MDPKKKEVLRKKNREYGANPKKLKQEGEYGMIKQKILAMQKEKEVMKKSNVKCFLDCLVESQNVLIARKQSFCS